MSLFEFLMSLWISAALAFAGDNLAARGELRGRWYVYAAGRVLFALAVSELLVLLVILLEMRWGL